MSSGKDVFHHPPTLKKKEHGHRSLVQKGSVTDHSNTFGTFRVQPRDWRQVLCILLAVTGSLCVYLIITAPDFIHPYVSQSIYSAGSNTPKPELLISKIVLLSSKFPNQTVAHTSRKETIALTSPSMERIIPSTSRTERISLTTSKKDSVMSMTRPSPTHYITINFQGRLGNLLFQYASLYGIANQNNLIPVISRHLELSRYFHLNVSQNSYAHHYEKAHNEKKGCTFEPEAMKLGEKNNYRLVGYFQSWKYFKNVEDVLRQELKFNSEITRKASEQFSAITASVKGEVTYVAVHIRRGDMVTNKQYVDYGYISADVDYVTRAIDYMRTKISKAFFIVASDDLGWCKNNFKSEDITYVKPGNTAAVDMAILTKCQHAIITVGSYGWWVAWLINGITVYYKDYPKPGTQLAKLFNSEDYRPPKWIGL